MTVINLGALHTVIGEPDPVDNCTASATYWAGRGPFINIDGADVIFPSPIPITIINGAPTVPIDLEPTESRCCVRWVFKYGSRTFTVYTEIPDSPTPVDFGDLVVVNPDTFAPEPLTPTLFSSLLMAMFGASSVVRLTQAEYDALPTPRPTDVLYVITP